MTAYMVEWWDEASLKYHQEYYTSIMLAAHRIVMLDNDVKNSDARISTIVICTDD